MFNLDDEVEYSDFMASAQRYPARVLSNSVNNPVYPLVVVYMVDGDEFVECLTSDGRLSPAAEIRLFKKPAPVKEYYIHINRRRDGFWYAGQIHMSPTYRMDDLDENYVKTIKVEL